MSSKHTPQAFVRLLERGIRDVLKDKQAGPADRLKAIEIGAKVAALQLKGGTGDGEKFFD